MPYNSLSQPVVDLSRNLPTPDMNRIVDPTAPVRQAQEQRMAREEELARQEASKASERQDKVLEKMISDPKNAKVYSQMYNVPITPEIDVLLREPIQAQKLLEAHKITKDMGVENPTAVRSFVETYLKTGDLLKSQAAIEGMDARAPLTRYQEESLGLSRDRLGSAQRIAEMRASNNTGREKPAMNIPAGFMSNVSSTLDKMRGVVYTDDTRTKIVKGSPQPLAPDVVMDITNLAAQKARESGNPVAAISEAYQEVVGDGGLVEGENSPIGGGMTGLEPVKYVRPAVRRAPQVSAGSGAGDLFDQMEAVATQPGTPSQPSPANSSLPPRQPGLPNPNAPLPPSLTKGMRPYPTQQQPEPARPVSVSDWKTGNLPASTPAKSFGHLWGN